MGRPIVLSNGKMFIGLDEQGLVHDFYYPHVGLENLTTARSAHHKIGIWVDGEFSWVCEGPWQIDMSYEPGALISNIRMSSEKLGIVLECIDFIDPVDDAFIRRITVHNNSDSNRDVRVFMHQVFQISRAGRADTALYEPHDHYVFTYKGNCCLLIAGRTADDEDFDQYAVGNYNIEGKAGTFLDAVDGELSGNNVEHGGVDSIIRFRKQIEPYGQFQFNYWIVTAESQSAAQVVHTRIKYHSIEERYEKAQQFWKSWLAPAQKTLAKLPEEDRDEVERSLLIIKSHCDKDGSVLASGDSSIFNFGRDYYGYCWPRDAAYALWPLIRFGLYDEARRFFTFARRNMHKDGYLLHKYQADGSIGSTWHPIVQNGKRELPIQEDETATVIFMMGEYYEASQDDEFLEEYYEHFIKPCAQFMASFVDDATGLPHPSYDLWEQKFSTSTYTVCTVIAALETAIRFSEKLDKTEEVDGWKRVVARMRDGLQLLYHPDGYFRKGLLLQDDGNLTYDDTLDISNLYGPYMYARLPLHDERMKSTLAHVEEKLLNTSPIGGVIRYPGDGYFLSKGQYGGNPWIVCTLWLAQYFHTADRIDDAKQLLKWALDRSLPSGIMSEQFDPETGFSLGVAPLVWSHAEFINTTLDIAQTTHSHLHNQ